jgi:hypothetical protein
MAPEPRHFSWAGLSLPRLPTHAWSGNVSVYSVPGMLYTGTAYPDGRALDISCRPPLAVVIPGLGGRWAVGKLTYSTPPSLSLTREFPGSPG